MMTMTKADNEGWGAIEQGLRELRREVRRYKSGRWDAMRNKVTHVASDVSDHIKAGVGAARHHISKHPLTFTTSSFGAGAVVGAAIMWMMLRDGR